MTITPWRLFLSTLIYSIVSFLAVCFILLFLVKGDGGIFSGLVLLITAIFYVILLITTLTKFSSKNVPVLLNKRRLVITFVMQAIFYLFLILTITHDKGVIHLFIPQCDVRSPGSECGLLIPAVIFLWTTGVAGYPLVALLTVGMSRKISAENKSIFYRSKYYGWQLFLSILVLMLILGWLVKQVAIFYF